MNGTKERTGEVMDNAGMRGHRQGLRRVDKHSTRMRVEQYDPSSTDPGGGDSGPDGVSPTRKTSLLAAIGQRSEVTKTLGALSDSHNPYSMYGESDNLDDGINVGLTSHTNAVIANGVEDGRLSGDDEMPPEDEIQREFADYMEVMSPMTEPEEVALQNTNTAEKWNLICNQRQRSPIFNIRYYIENLRQNQGTRRRKFSIGKKSSVTALSYVLRKLKLDLKMSSPSFLEEFSEPPNGGLHLLVELLRSMQFEEGAMQTNRRAKMDEYKRILEDEVDCLLCLKFLTRTEEGKQKLFRQEGIFDLFMQTTLSPNSKCRAVALQLLSVLVTASTAGYQRVVEAFGRQRQRLNEPALCRTICTLLSEAEEPNDLQFLVAAVHLFNTLLTSLSNANASVHLQHELERAGFNPDQLDKLSYGNTVEHEDLGRELEVWRKHYIDVTSTREEVGGLEARNTLLREEVTRLQDQLRAVEKSNRQQEREKRRMSEKRDDYRERAAELQDTVTKLTKLYSENTGKAAEETVNVVKVLKPLDVPSDNALGDKFSTVRSIGDVISDMPTPPAPPLPPPAPPLAPPKRKMTSATSEMPLLNWTPILTVTNTIFQDLNDEGVYKHIDFADFESRFKLQRRAEGKDIRQKWQHLSAKQHSTKLLFVNMNRAKNLCITKHRTGLTSRQIRDAIERCNVTALPGEYAELLIKFIPAKDELKMLAQHRDEYWNMGEAEQFLFQLAQVERLESKLSLLVFIGIFDELLQSVRPNIIQVLEASTSVLNSKGLKKIFEIILAFGNYMNGSKRGYTMGFRLESLYKLSDVKTVDKQHTLLHYLAEQVRTNYPELLTFSDNMDLRVNKGASFHSMLQDVKGLRKGLDLVKFEKEKQINNPVIERFHADASQQVAAVAESFKKMEALYKEVCLTYGENYKHIEPDCFFGTLADFTENFKKACQENTRKSRPLPASSSRSNLVTSPVVTSPSSGKTFADLSAITQTPPHPPQNVTKEPTKEVKKVVNKEAKKEPPKPTTKEPPKILSALTPQVGASSVKVQGQLSRKEAPRVGAIAAQHNVMTSRKAMPPSKDTNGPPAGVKVEEKHRKLSVKRSAPVPPAETAASGSKPHLTNGVAVTPAVVVTSVGAKEQRPLSVEIPEPRLRASSEPSTADLMAALGQLDQVVAYEETYGGIPEEQSMTSHL